MEYSETGKPEMSLCRLVQRSLGFYWRTNLAVLLAAMVSVSILVGALVVGDSVRHSLRMMATTRLGKTQFALSSANRFFSSKLADEVAAELNTMVAPVLKLRGLISNGDGTSRANRVEVLGVDERFYQIGGGGNPFGDDRSQGAVLNGPLAARLGVQVGDEIVLRAESPGLMPRDIPLTPDSDLSIAFRLVVKAVAGESEFGRFSLQANQVAPLNVYVPLEWLQDKLDRSAQANMLLVAESTKSAIMIERVNEAIRQSWQLADAGLELRRLDGRDMLEIRSNRVFIDQPLAAGAMSVSGSAVGVLTYFVNELRLGDRTTPYSMVTGLGQSEIYRDLLPTDMQDDEILINRWLADDLGAKAGGSIGLTYYVLGPMRKLLTQQSSFRVREIVPMENPAMDRELMPDFPGLADAENCRDWQPGVEIELDKIRQRDEDYWHTYRGAPKAFVTLSAAQSIWGNRYGNLTAVRYPLSEVSQESLAEKLLSAVDPASIGLYFQPVRARGLKAGDEATDFGQLFLGFSMFLIAAALLLMALLFVFGVEKRSEQVGMLLAVGFPPKLVKTLFLIEGGTLAVLGAIGGTAVGLLYTKAMVYGLGTVWRTAVAGSAIHFYVRQSTLFAGAPTGIVVSVIAIWLTLRKKISRPARELLAGDIEWQFFLGKPISKGKVGFWVAALAAMAAAAILIGVGARGGRAVAGAFFGAGALLLVAGFGLSQALLRIAAGGWRKPAESLAGLGLRNSARRSGRSLGVVALLACGVFLVIAVGANRHDPLAHSEKRDSGTGGFVLFGESSVGILHDLNSDSGRQSLGLDDDVLKAVEILQLRVHDGDDASCFNLNRAQRPRLLGICPELLQVRGAFHFVDAIEGADKEDCWDLLALEAGDDVVPAIGDYSTVVWALGKSVGDELEYTDEKGRSFKLRIVAMLKNSILQGSLLISEEDFVNRFGSEDGYRMFLVDAPREATNQVMDVLSYRLRDFGIELTPATQRLAAFNAVENTYLSIFQLLGGLGLILGSVGLGMVVVRNILDRRGELAMMRAVGFERVALKRMVFYEHSGLMLGGLLCGVAAALMAVVPALMSPRAQVPYLSLALTVAAIAVSGGIWIWVATHIALGGKLLDALRSE
jgi:putative ABC transport system permease protein